MTSAGTRGVRTEVSGLTTYRWLPASPPRAVLVARTPYGAAGHAAEAEGWARHGVAMVVQDVRGRHESPGCFVPYAEQAGTDGPELLTWVRSWASTPVILLGLSYGAHTALATATATTGAGTGGTGAGPDGVVAAVPALGLGETSRTRGGVLQLASRLGWWLAHDVRRPWSDVLAAQRTDAARAAAVGTMACPLLAIGGTDDYFAHDTADLAAAWGGPTQLVMGPWGHGLDGAHRARRILRWLDQLLAGEPPTGVETVDRAGATRDDGQLPMASVRLDLAAAAPSGHAHPWCASLRIRDRHGAVREIAHGAAFGDRITLGPLVLTDTERARLDLHLSAEDFPRYARAPTGRRPDVPDHYLELTA